MVDTEATEVPYDEIDPDIRPLVAAMNADDHIRTYESCSGHEDRDHPVDRRAHVVLAVRGMYGLRAFDAAIETIKNQFGDQVRVDVFFEGVEADEWIMLVVEIARGADPPSKSMLAKIADVFVTEYRRARGSEAAGRSAAKPG